MLSADRGRGGCKPLSPPTDAPAAACTGSSAETSHRHSAELRVYNPSLPRSHVSLIPPPHRRTTADVMACTHPTSSARALRQPLCECVSVRVHVRWARGRAFCFAGSARSFRKLGTTACGSSSSSSSPVRPVKVTGPRPSVCRGLLVHSLTDIVILDGRLSTLIILLQTGYYG